MTDCGRVEDWLNGQNSDHITFRSKAEVQEWTARKGTETDGAFWECVDNFDFEDEFKLFRYTSKRGKKYRQLRRIDRASKFFKATDLDAGAMRSIREFLGGLDD